MKFLYIIFALILLPINGFASLSDSFFLDSFLTLEYSAPSVSGNYGNRNFANNPILKQLTNFDNIQIGYHGRIQKYLGFNISLVKTKLKSPSLSGYNLAEKTTYSQERANLSLMAFAPIIGDSFVEAFGEIGVSQIKGKIKINDINLNSITKSSTQMQPFMAIGMQFSQSDSSKDSFRFTFGRYLQKISLINANLNFVNIGYIKEF